MLSRTSGCLFFFTVLSACPAGLVCSAQQAEPGTLVRYHFGDDSNGKLGWASSSFEDNTWPVAKEGNWPMPPFYSDGFV